MEDLINEFNELNQVEKVRDLDTTESNRYFYLWDTLKSNNIQL
jgi:hypothetical protein